MLNCVEMEDRACAAAAYDPGFQRFHNEAFTGEIAGVASVVLVVAFALNRSFYPTSAVPPVSFLILHPREIPIQNLWSDSETEKNQTLKNQGRKIKC